MGSLKSTQEKQTPEENSYLSTQVPAKSNSSSWKNRRQRKTTHRYSVRDARKTQLSTSDSEGNSDEKAATMLKHRRSQVLQPFLTSPPKEQYLAGRCTFPEDEEALSCRGNVDDFKQIIPVQESNSLASHEPAAAFASCLNNSSFDLCHVLLSLLEKLCKVDIASNHKSALAANVISTLTELLSKLGDCYSASGTLENDIVSSSWTGEPVALVQRMLFRTVLHLMAMDVNNAETMPGNLRKNLIDLLKAALAAKGLLEKPPHSFFSRQLGALPKEIQGDRQAFSRCHHQSLLLPEFVEGVLQILTCCLQSAASNPIYFSQAMDLVHEFIQHQGFKLFEDTVLQMEWLVAREAEVNTEVPEYLKALINSIMKIISTIKKVKSEQLHQSVCTRKRHRRCEYSHFMHHHRDLSGLPVSTFKNQVSKNPFEESADGEVHYPDRCCCIAVCAHQSLRLLEQLSLGSTCFQILSGIHNVGICCCMDPRSVIIPLLHSFRSQVLKNFQPHILSILNKFILDQLGGAQVSQKLTQASCNICTFDGDQLAELDVVLHGNNSDLISALSSAPYRFQGILPSRGSEDMLLKWDALEAYQSLVFEEDDKMRCMQIASHVCNLIQKGNEVIQWKLYNYIFSPVLQRGVELAHQAQQQGVTAAFSQTGSYHKKCLPQEVLQIYLQTLPSLFKSRFVHLN